MMSLYWKFNLKFMISLTWGNCCGLAAARSAVTTRSSGIRQCLLDLMVLLVSVKVGLLTY